MAMLEKKRRKKNFESTYCVQSNYRFVFLHVCLVAFTLPLSRMNDDPSLKETQNSDHQLRLQHLLPLSHYLLIEK